MKRIASKNFSGGKLRKLFQSSLAPLVSLVFAPFIAVLSLSGCDDLLSEYVNEKKCLDMKFERFIKSDKIIIIDNTNNKLNIIHDKEVINKIILFSLSHKKNWVAPLGGTPIPFVSAEFYNEGEFIGDFGVGSNSLIAQGCGYFYSREISIKEKKFILNVFLNT